MQSTSEAMHWAAQLRYGGDDAKVIANMLQDADTEMGRLQTRMHEIGVMLKVYGDWLEGDGHCASCANCRHYADGCPIVNAARSTGRDLCVSPDFSCGGWQIKHEG